MRYVSLDEAVGVVQHGDRVYVHGGVCTPRVLVEGLVAIRQDVHDVEIVHLHTDTPAPYVEPGMEGRFRHNALFIGPNVRQAVQEGRADYTPIFLSDIPRQFEPGGALPLDVAFIQVSPPDREGRCTLGVSVDCAMAAAIHARTVVAQVNPRMPRTFGHSLDASFIDLAVEVDEPLPQVVLEEPGPEAMAIGRHVASLVADGSTLQMGIGTIPSAVLRELTGHRDLGVHT
jgi:acyl-CoA hydrolase